MTVAVGWIGLGEMGLPMAGNLAAAGHRVVGFDLDGERTAAATTVGVAPAASLAEAVSGADVVVTMVRTGAQTGELLVELASLVEAPPLDVLMMSTLEPELAEELGRSHAGRLRLVDAPVSGGVRGAEAGTLAVMAAGAPDAVDRVRPLLDVLGGSVFVLGSTPGLGQAAKVANQVMMGAALAGTMEALELARSYGLEDAAVVDAVLAGTGASWVLAHWDWMRSLWEDYEPGNGLDILVKDLRATIASGERQELELPSAKLALRRLLAARG